VTYEPRHEIEELDTSVIMANLHTPNSLHLHGYALDTIAEVSLELDIWSESTMDELSEMVHSALPAVLDIPDGRRRLERTIVADTNHLLQRCSVQELGNIQKILD
jgi:hypothetical protein